MQEEGLFTYREDSDKFRLSPEQAAVFAREAMNQIFVHSRSLYARL